MQEVRGKRIYVGLSGGVDSAVSTALLIEAGAEVTGVFIKGWYPPGMPCAWAEERRDAMRVAARLHVPFRTLDASAEYKSAVIDYLLNEYRSGRTPNPDVMCNREVKFGTFYRYAISHGADAIAMGHYRTGDKDQSYFLWAVPKAILATAIFPVGNMEKEKVRLLAKKFNLPVAEKRDSQGICFLGAVSVKEFLEVEFGSDNPALLYTIGQRVSGEALPRDVLDSKGPWYVRSKNVNTKEITVSRSHLETKQEIKFTDANWHNESSEVNIAQYRYRGARIKGRVDNSCFISSEPLPDIPAAGQSVVFYKDNELIGGAIITE